jgi:uncharacterized membrane-anchored protein
MSKRHPMVGAAGKVAAVTLGFWILKILATTLGETGGDWLTMTLGLGYGAGSLLLLAIFAVTLVAQLRAKRFHRWLYWSVILSTSTAGTAMSDFMDRTLGLGYLRGSLLLASLLGLVLAAWWRSEGHWRAVVPSFSIGWQSWSATRWAPRWGIFWRTPLAWALRRAPR